MDKNIPKPHASKVWTTLITNTAYLSGLLTLEYSLRRVGSKYPLVVLYTDSFPAEGHKALDSRNILKRHVRYLLPSAPKDFTNDVRFYDCWSKLTPFSLVEYERVVQLDSDMLVLQNMDELMDLDLDPPDMAGNGDRVFAASHACTCNPLHKPHYPADWVPANCAYSTQHENPDIAQTVGAPATSGLGIPNGGLQVVNPAQATYEKITGQLATSTTSSYDFADQSLLGDLFYGRWVALPYIYNALKTMRVEGVHDTIWRDENVKNVHYILSPKPWDDLTEKQDQDPTHPWWTSLNEKRWSEEQESGTRDQF
ncbi:Glycosyl transferase family 8 [Penicillium cf. griseofulvum]|uniref:Glycosyl transferase family 8 n=1 Tax=Penicillium cf. griseofulvum TaxID=2972120 RepID=A0A9W9JDX7_9EURO|nr:Glycosyl transferase family 8 [Penicillium cf. griseofulvum]KAJ5445480.1 Glycosyl transferase family 8 [Penicillium cf. griseofulvum]